MRENILKNKSFNFALDVIKIYKQIIKQEREYVLSKQFLRSGTSVGALVREAEFAQSKADFISKLSIALKEANETEYWIELLVKSDYLDRNKAQNLLSTNKEIISMLVASVKTTKNTIGK